MPVIAPARSPSLALRATLAVALMIGFYLLALGIATALVLVPYAELRYGHRLDVRVLVFCLGAAGAIVLGVLPRRDRFTPPGPRLDPAEQPELFDALRSTASAVGETLPPEVYLLPDANAWVTQRGGVMGFGGRRVMGIGLPLLQILTASELRAVIAHEYGHFQGGDTALGPWVYRTREAILRTLHGVARRSGIVAKPFLWYGKAFVRVTHAVSRRQEFAADALAARAVGARELAGALRALHGPGAAFEPYLHTEVLPALSRGYRPPLAAGFSQFVAAPPIERQAESLIERELREGVGDPYDTHPPLRDRLTALGSPDLSGGERAPAIALLRDVPRLEHALFDAIVRPEVRESLKPMTWEEAGDLVWLPSWREVATNRASNLQNLLPPMLARYAGREPELAYMMGFAPSASAATDEHVGLAHETVGAALAVALHQAGFRIAALPGMPVELTRGALTLRPFSVLSDLRDGTLDAAAWTASCQAAGIDALDLGTLSVSA